MVARRMLLIVAILMGITALTAGLAAPPRPRTADPSAAPPVTAGSADPVEVRRAISDGGRARTVAVEEGERLILTVRVDALDSVELVGLDRVAAVAPGTPAVFDVLADRPGLYPVETGVDGRRLGAVRVTPSEE